MKFEDKAAKNTPASQTPFAQVFDEYALKGVPENVATPLAGLVGTLAVFGLAGGIGKLTVRGSSDRENEQLPSSDDSDT